MIDINKLKKLKNDQIIYYIDNKEIKEVIFLGKSNIWETFKIKIDGYIFHEKNFEDYFENEKEAIQLLLKNNPNNPLILSKYINKYPELFII